MAQDYGLNGRVVVVTGAASGIGYALALAFARQRATLVLLDRSGDALQAVAAELKAYTPVSAYPCDLADDAAVQHTAKQIGAAHAQVHVLVNNAGIEFPTPLSDTAADANTRWAGLLDNNVTSMARLTRALLAQLGAGASIINQASIWGKTGVADCSAYVASNGEVMA